METIKFKLIIIVALCSMVVNISYSQHIVYKFKYFSKDPLKKQEDTLREMIVENLEHENFIDTAYLSQITNNTALSEFYISGLSMNPLLNQVLIDYIFYYRSDSNKLKIFIPLSKSVELYQIQDCIKLLNSYIALYDKRRLIDTTTGKFANTLNEISRAFSFTKSSEDLSRPRTFRNPISISYSSGSKPPDNYSMDILGGFNIHSLFEPLSFRNTMINIIFPYYEVHVSTVSGTHIEDYGGETDLTFLFKKMLNLRTNLSFNPNFLRTYTNPESTPDFRYGFYFNFGFEPRNLLRCFLPSYEPIGISAEEYNKRFEVVSWAYTLTIGYENGYDTFKPKLNAFVGRFDGVIYFAERIIELDITMQTRSPRFDWSFLNRDENAIFRQYSIKLNLSAAKKTYAVSGLKSGINLSLSFDYLFGTDPILGIKGTISRKLTIGIIF